MPAAISGVLDNSAGYDSDYFAVSFDRAGAYSVLVAHTPLMNPVMSIETGKNEDARTGRCGISPALDDTPESRRKRSLRHAF